MLRSTLPENTRQHRSAAIRAVIVSAYSSRRIVTQTRHRVKTGWVRREGSPPNSTTVRSFDGEIQQPNLISLTAFKAIDVKYSSLRCLITGSKTCDTRSPFGRSIGHTRKKKGLRVVYAGFIGRTLAPRTKEKHRYPVAMASFVDRGVDARLHLGSPLEPPMKSCRRTSGVIWWCCWAFSSWNKRDDTDGSRERARYNPNQFRVRGSVTELRIRCEN